MKNASIFTLALAAISLIGMSFTTPENGGTETLKANVAESTIEWKGYKVTGEHSGTVNLKSGDLKFEEGNLVGGSFVIDMTSIENTDMEGEWSQKLVGHLKSDDFFGVENHPTAKFEITKVISRGTPGNYKILGNLTIKDITKPIKFFTHLEEEGNKVTATAEMTIDRSDYDVRYGSGSFFDNLGDKTIYDEFDMIVTMVTTK
ncbi:MAG: YceI family protein [Chitinophagales bacterium]|nr:YceI family protein [Chitinophagales bacterium]